MKPQPKHQPLYFTPRTPWGTRLPGRSFFDHLKASEDEGQRPDLLPKELQRIGAPKNPPGQSSLGRHGVPQTLSGQITPERAGEMTDKSPKLPPFTPAPSQSPQPADMTHAIPHASQLQQALQQQSQRWPFNGQKANSWTEQNALSNMNQPAPGEKKHFHGGFDYSKQFRSDEPAELRGYLEYQTNPKPEKEGEDEVEDDTPFDTLEEQKEKEKARILQ